MASFEDLQSAAKMRDVIERIAAKTVDKKRPDIRIGKVYRFSPGEQVAWIQFPGDSDDDLVKVRTAMDKIPTRSIAQYGPETADIVRVAGKPGSYFILDFVSGVPYNVGEAGDVGEPVITPGEEDEYWRGDKTWQKLHKAHQVNFASPSFVWNVVHNFGIPTIPTVETFDTNGSKIEGDVEFINENTLKVSWFIQVAGSVRVSI